MSSTRRLFAPLTGPGLLLLALTACGSPRSSTPSPSIVLVTLDTTRADRLGAYGSPAGLTPALDRLAEGGTLFEMAIAQAAVTPVSHASILTGLAPYSHGLRVLHGHEHNRLAPEQVTLAERLRERGFATAAFVSAFPAGSYFGLEQGFDLFDEGFAPGTPEGGDSGSPVSEQGAVNTGLHQRRADDTTDRALAWLESAASPYLLWVHYFDPHDPAVLPPQSYLEDLPDPRDGERDFLRELYDREVAFMDHEIGRLLDGLDGDPIVVVVADHGEGLGDHDWWTHGVLYQEQLRVPMLMAGPGVPEGLRVRPVVRTVDLAPTLLSLVGSPPQAGSPLDGRDLRPVLEEATDGRSLPAYADSLSTITYRFTPTISDRKEDLLFALVVGDWKYIHHLQRPEESELYDLARDPGELVNRLDDEPERAAKMRGALDGLPLLPRRDPATAPTDADAEAARRLRALGYVD